MTLSDVGAAPPYLGADCTYTATTATFSSADSLSATHCKVGAWVKTKHSTPCLGMIMEVNGSTITVDMWANSSTTTTMPDDGVGLNINPFNKGWTANFNVLIPAETQYKTATGLELGILNNGITNPMDLNADLNV